MKSAADEKLLTVSVAAYNVESYIAQALDSLCTEHMDRLEVIVVDDGATDGTPDIARDFAERYPQTFRFVHKENGGYGTTVNTSLQLAMGKYFKLLDGDDWFDSDGLEHLLDVLANTECDLMVDPHVCRYGDVSETVEQMPNVPEGLHELEAGMVPRIISMHSATFRTQLLRDAGLELPGGCLYTDGLFVVVPMALVRTVYVTHVPVYQYRLGRGGQSMLGASLVAHRDDLRKVLHGIGDVYLSAPEGSFVQHMALQWMVSDAVNLMKACHMLDDTSQGVRESRELRAYLSRTGKADEECCKVSGWYRMLSRAPGILYIPLRQLLWKRMA